MILYTNGCSYTKGTELSLNGDFSLSYPNRLAKKLDAKLVDRSIIGQSNFLICKRTIEDIISMVKKPDLVIIQWTFCERFNTPWGLIEMTNFPEKKNIYRTHLPVDEARRNHRNKDFYRNYFDLKNNIHIQALIETTMHYMYTLQSFLEKHSYDFIFLDVDNIYEKSALKKEALKSNNKFYSKLLDEKKWLHDLNTNITLILDSYNYQVSRKIVPETGVQDDHFLPDAHEFLSEAILDFYYLKDKLYPKTHALQNRQRDLMHFYGEDI